MHEKSSFAVFMQESGNVGSAYQEAMQALSEASALDRKTDELAYIAILAAVRQTEEVPVHVKAAKLLGATRDEIKSAVLVGMPAVGFAVTEAFAVALKSYDEE